MTAAPSYPHDLFTDQVLSDPTSTTAHCATGDPWCGSTPTRCTRWRVTRKRGPSSAIRGPTAPCGAWRSTTPRTAGARVVVLYASANRDERHFPPPDEFDITRPNAGEHLGFGWGVHGCAGQGLPRMETHALLTALAEQIDRIDLTAPATAVLNNLINARASVPVTVTPARTTGTGPGGGQDRALTAS